MRDALIPLLHDLASGEATPEVLASVRALVADWPEDDVLHEALHETTWEDPRADAVALLPLVDEDAPDGLGTLLRQAVTTDERVDVTGGVLGALGLDEGWPVAEAIEAEAGRIEVAPGFDPAALPLAEAIAAEAGQVDLAAAIVGALSPRASEDEADHPDMLLSAMLDQALDADARKAATRRLTEDPEARQKLAAWADLGRQLRTAVKGEAGALESLWSPIGREIGLADPEAVPGWDESALGRAVASEAGQVDVVEAVMARIAVDRARDLLDAPEVPEPATTLDGWQVALGLLAAAVVFVLVVPAMIRGAGDPSMSGSDGFTEQATRFATADEISVDRIATGADASVFVEMPADENAPLIIWVDDGGTL